MKYLDEGAGMRDADSGDEEVVSEEKLQQELAAAQQELIELPAGYAPIQKAEIQNRIAEILVDLRQTEAAFDTAREAFDTFVAAEQWEGAVHACNIMFMADQPWSLAALGQGVWLAVTFPIDPELSVAGCSTSSTKHLPTPTVPRWPRRWRTMWWTCAPRASSATI